MRLALVLCVSAAITAGCGASEKKNRPAATVAADCGTELVPHAADVVDPMPAGYETRPPQDRSELEQLAANYKHAIGPHYRGADFLIVTPKSDKHLAQGVALMLINSTAKDSQGTIEGTIASLHGKGIDDEPLTVGGRDGSILHVENQWIALAPSGPCGFVTLIAGTEKRVRDLAAVLPHRAG